MCPSTGFPLPRVPSAAISAVAQLALVPASREPRPQRRPAAIRWRSAKSRPAVTVPHTQLDSHPSITPSLSRPVLVPGRRHWCHVVATISSPMGRFTCDTPPAPRRGHPATRTPVFDHHPTDASTQLYAQATPPHAPSQTPCLITRVHAPFLICTHSNALVVAGTIAAERS